MKIKPGDKVVFFKHDRCREVDYNPLHESPPEGRNHQWAGTNAKLAAFMDGGIPVTIKSVTYTKEGLIADLHIVEIQGWYCNPRWIKQIIGVPTRKLPRWF